MAGRSRLRLKIDEWDTGFFGIPVARINVDGNKSVPGFSDKLSNLLKKAGFRGIRFIIVKLINPRRFYEECLLRNGLKDYGRSVDSVFRYGKIPESGFTKDLKVRMLKAEDRKAVESIARSAFSLSYLYRCGIAERSKVDDYHAAWVRNLINDKDSRVFVALKKGKIAGFLALRVDKNKESGRIILIAVHEKFRGSGVGNELMGKCLKWGNGKLKKIFVKTQEINKKALGLYRKAGFVPFESDKVFCKRLP
jgi:ribosomal protein S18 acetylase RimI-like enzyme